MSELLGIMLNVISPIFIIVGLVILIARRMHPDQGGISMLLIYLFIPALAFNGISHADLRGGQAVGVAAVAIMISFTMVIIGMLITRLGRFNRMQDSAFMISIILVNAANYGIPVNTFAFGTEGQQRALIYYVISVMVGNTLGIYFASRGEGSVRQAFMNVLRVPITYAAVAGLIVNLAQISVPLPIERATSVLAQAAVPGMLVLLGLKLSEATLQVRWKPLLLAVGIRLLLSPMIAFVYATLLGLTGVAFQVAIVQSGMPTAVLANALASQFHSDGEFTSAATLLSTLGSIVTLSVIITLLKG